MRTHDFRGVWLVFLSSFVCLGVHEADFIGADRCQLCHRAIYTRWKETPHSRATETLDIEIQTRSCSRCHATGPAALPGVQCEACHGAGGNYWPAEIMIDSGKARQAGLVQPDENTCRRCHASGLPGHADRFEMPGRADLPRSVH